MSFVVVKIIIMIFLILTIILSSIYLYLLIKDKSYEAKRHNFEMLELDNQILINKTEELSNKEEDTIDIDDLTPTTNNQIVLTKVEKKTFSELANDLLIEDLNYLNEIKKYVLGYENIELFDRKYYQVISYGQRKTICQLYIKDGHILVKINLGKIKVSKELEPIKTKPIKILVKDEESLNEAKRQIEVGFYKQSGAIKISMEGSN